MFHLNALLGSLGRRAAWCRAMHAVRAATAFDAVSARATWAALPREEWRQAVGSTEPGIEILVWHCCRLPTLLDRDFMAEFRVYLRWFVYIYCGGICEILQIFHTNLFAALLLTHIREPIYSYNSKIIYMYNID